MNLIKIIMFLSILTAMEGKTNAQQKTQYNDLSIKEADIIKRKGTEPPFSEKFEKYAVKGTYLCKQCGNALFYSDSKFNSGCGWPSFDREIDGAVKRLPDADGQRTEIQCSVCGAHLGHVFTGEGFTPLNTRNCVNSISLEFVPEILPAGRYGTAVFAGGCFWGVEYYMQQAPGVVSVISGFTGGTVKDPTYKEVCTGTTGHAEAVKITYNVNKTDYETLTRLFLEIHDPTQMGHQGPDVGDQYRSEIFYENDEQKQIAEKCLNLLKEKGYKTVTRVTHASEFYQAEDYHQDYYFNNGKQPYCHSRVQRF